MTKFMRAAVYFLPFCCLIGCESGASVTGTVTTKGEKVTSGNLTFTPVGVGKAASTNINSDGTYSIKGVVTGKNSVVFAPASSTEPIALKPGEKAKSAPFEGLQAKNAEVDLKQGENKVDVDLVPRK
ncbi:MAG: hypothetical protein U0744_09140 [Gemmataceae bacterium]